MTRDQQIAHLILHGWEPVRDGLRDNRSYRGIWNSELRTGYGRSLSMAGPRIIALLEASWCQPIPCGWDEVDDSVLTCGWAAC